jgi:cytochrome c peroxidase
MTRLLFVLPVCVLVGAMACARQPQSMPAPVAEWEAANPVVPLPAPPLGIDARFADLKEPPTPARVRLGRWLFFDTRLSADNTTSCATCHSPAQGFSETERVSTGIRNQRGTRKSPGFVNAAWRLYPVFFWDGRADSLEMQSLGPIANPIEMGNTHEAMVRTLSAVRGYRQYFKEVFGTGEITKERVAKAIADYERTCMSGDSPWDRWRKHQDEAAVSDQVKQGHELFFGKAACSQCHLGQNFTDDRFHNLGVGWNPRTRTFADEGRFIVTKIAGDRGAFKTPTLRDVAKHAPYMHDGSMATLHDVVEHYREGGARNPHLDPRITRVPLTDAEVDALVKFMEALTGQNQQESAPRSFPM